MVKREPRSIADLFDPDYKGRVTLLTELYDIEFVQPEEGFLLWSDNMQIPVGAPSAFTAQRMMDFVYRPEVQVDITEWVNYVCPVKGVQELIERRDPELAQSELIFPSDESLENSTDLRPLHPEEEREVEDAFQRVLGA